MICMSGNLSQSLVNPDAEKSTLLSYDRRLDTPTDGSVKLKMNWKNESEQLLCFGEEKPDLVFHTISFPDLNIYDNSHISVRWSEKMRNLSTAGNASWRIKKMFPSMLSGREQKRCLMIQLSYLQMNRREIRYVIRM